MLGTFVGDVVGSIYEFSNIKTKDFPLFQPSCFFTDDSILTVEVMRHLLQRAKGENTNLADSFAKAVATYPSAGWGGSFFRWANYDPYERRPYNSFGNGAGMRVAPVAYVAKDLEECLALADYITSITHNHPEGIKGARAIASCVYLARAGRGKEQIRNYISSHFYPLDFTLDEIRDSYQFDVSCQGSCPQAIVCFLESNSFEDAIRNAISIGGDSDTIAAMTGAIAEAYYKGVPLPITSQLLPYLNDDMLNVAKEFYATFLGEAIA